MDQYRTPYFQALLDYVDSGVLPFHTPGHVQGIGMDLAFREFVGDNICAIDLTPMPGIDDLLQPTRIDQRGAELGGRGVGRRPLVLLDQRFDQRQPMHDDDGCESGRRDRRAAQLAQIDARRSRDERRRARSTCSPRSMKSCTWTTA